MIVMLNSSGHFIDRSETFSYLQAASSLAGDRNDNQDRNEHTSEISKFEPFSPAASPAAEFNNRFQRTPLNWGVLGGCDAENRGADFVEHRD